MCSEDFWRDKEIVLKLTRDNNNRERICWSVEGAHTLNGVDVIYSVDSMHNHKVYKLHHKIAAYMLCYFANIFLFPRGNMSSRTKRVVQRRSLLVVVRPPAFTLVLNPWPPIVNRRVYSVEDSNSHRNDVLQPAVHFYLR